MAINISADFQKFVNFASDAGNKKTIVNAFKQPSGLAVLEHSGDGVGFFAWKRRDQGHAGNNDRTRDIFMKTVANMFGGSESQIPESVKKAMHYNTFSKGGRPLTARRVMAVKVAIDKLNAAEAKAAASAPKTVSVAPKAVTTSVSRSKLSAPRGNGADVIAAAMKGRVLMKNVTAEKTEKAKKADPADFKPLKIDAAKAKQMIADSCKLLGVTLSAEDAEAVADQLRAYGNKLPARNARALSNYIVRCAVNGDFDEDMLAGVAKDMKTWREFDFGDKKLSTMGKKFVQRQNNYLKQTLPDGTKYMSGHPDVFENFYKDANRGTWRIGDKSFKLGADPDAVLNEFLKTVKDPNARKVVSTLFNQGNLADLSCLAFKTPALVGSGSDENVQEETIHTLKGGNMFVSRDMGRDGLKIIADAEIHYELDVSKDGKTATVTVTQNNHLSVDGHAEEKNRFGKVSISQKTTIDLTKPTPVVTNVAFAQTYTPDEIRKN